MAVTSFQLDVGLIGRALTADLPPMRHMQFLARKVWCGKSQVSSKEEGTTGEEGMPPEEVQNFLWQHFFSDPTQWWDNRRTKPTARHADFKHKRSKVALWLNHRHKPPWVDSQLARWDAGMKMSAECVSTSIQGQAAPATHEGHLEVEMCGKLCEDGRITEVVDALDLLVHRGGNVHNNLFYRVLKRCIANKDLVLGRRVHALTIQSGYEGDAFLATHLIGLYASHGSLEEAMRVFCKVSTPSLYNWASIIFAYARRGVAAQAIRLYRQMLEAAVKPDNHIYVAVLNACATAGDLVAGREVHAHILASPGKPHMFVQTSLFDMYAKCRSLDEARRVFDTLAERNVVTWNAMLASYAQQGRGEEAITLYNSMQQEGTPQPNSVTFVCLLQACASIGVGALHEGKQLHAKITERALQNDMVLGGSLVNMYAKCGSAEDARRVFDRLSVKSVVTWTAMMGGYTQQGMGQEALSLYSSMQQEGLSPPDSVTFVCALQACASVGVGALHEGKQLHSQIEQRGLQDDAGIASSLVNMYAKCGSIGDARKLFDRLEERDVVTWNAMLAGYAQQGMGQEALSLYRSMEDEGLCPPDSCTFVCLLQACAIVAGLTLGKQLHAQIEVLGLQSDLLVGAALVNMYAKCGKMFESHQVFDSLPERTLEAWDALISGYTLQGDSVIVFDLLDRMRMEGIQPDSVTFLSVLAVCSHVGLVDKGVKYFEVMRTDYGISPTVDHYTCMMDLLGRAGHLDEALQMAKTMPFPPNGAVWHALLGACRKWNNVEIGQQAFEFAVRLDRKDAASFVLMANIYARAQMWEEAKEMQARRKHCGAWKMPGQCWWTDLGGAVHTFEAGDKKHPMSVQGSKQLVP